jgi:hypothetical protein
MKKKFGTKGRNNKMELNERCLYMHIHYQAPTLLTICTSSSKINDERWLSVKDPRRTTLSKNTELMNNEYQWCTHSTLLTSLECFRDSQNYSKLRS